MTNPYSMKEMYDLVNQPIVPTDELKRIICYQDVIPTTYREREENDEVNG